MKHLVSGSQHNVLNEHGRTVFARARLWAAVSDSGSGSGDGSGFDDDSNDESGAGLGTGTLTISKPKSQTKTPPLYRVILMNDDFTPMDFVIHVIQRFFNKDFEEATKIMLEVHYKGAGHCGTYSYEIAETKVYQVNQYAKQNKHPLKCTMEKA